MQVSKLKLSEEESSALGNSRFFELKHEITKKILELFGETEKELKRMFPVYGIDCDGLNFSAGKIFRGENYRMFPYILLDYPRLFNTKSVFAFRSMLWWGHEFSFTLHLQGEAFEKYGQQLFDGLKRLKGTETYYCISDTPWQYHFGNENYRLLDSGVTKEEFFGKNFCKLSRKIPAAHYENAAAECVKSFDMFLRLLSTH